MATKLGNAAVGTIVKIPENGVNIDYIVVNQGNPDSTIYDSSCDGTWLLRKEVLPDQPWANGVVEYPKSTIFSYLDTTFRPTIALNIRQQIKAIKIPYCAGTYNNREVKSGSNGASCKVFLLGAAEVGFIYPSFANDGARLKYFPEETSTGHREPKRIAYYSDNPTNSAEWWLRSWYLSSASTALRYIYAIDNGGLPRGPTVTAAAKHAVRPAFILPPELFVSDDGLILTNQPPTTPSSLTVPSSIQSQTNITITWGASTDPDSNLAGYQLERSLNSGTWTQVYQGTTRGFTDNLAYGTTTVQYRVRAYDTENEYSGYRTSTVHTVINNLPPTAPASITVPTPVAGHTVDITWGAATDPDGTVTSYQLERSVNNSGWTQIFSGNALTYTDTIGGGWGTVAYRVRAVDNMNAAGPYTTGETYTVQNDILYISGPAPDMGLQPKPFTFTFGVGISGSTATVDNVAVTASLDGYSIYTGNITSAQTVSLSIDVRTIGAGEHTIHVTADRPLSVGAKEDYGFTVAATNLPAGGYGTLLQDNSGEAVFPQTTAGLVAGLKDKSVGENLAELYAAIEAIQNAVQTGLDLYREEG